MGMQLLQHAMRGSGVWVRQVEHWVLRVASLLFSLASAHAIRWFFAPLDGVDSLMPIITWIIAIGFGVLGYFVSRGLAHRLMIKESVWAYAPICVVVEFVEIFCNFALAVAVIQRAAWLQEAPETLRMSLTILTYVALSIIPLVSVLLAVVDMDLERSKNSGRGSAAGPWSSVRPQPKSPAAGSYPTGYQAQPRPQGGSQNGAVPLAGVTS